MILFCEILTAILAVVVLAASAFVFFWCDWFKMEYPAGRADDAYPPYYYMVVLPWRAWRFRHTPLHGWYTIVPGLYCDTRTGEIYFYVWRNEEYL